MDLCLGKPGAGADLGGGADGFDGARRVGDPLAGDIEGGAVIYGRADNW